jgi:hypothetical protein
MTGEPIKGGLSDADIELLEKLASMRDRGILTHQEFEDQKAIIRGVPAAHSAPSVIGGSMLPKEPTSPTEEEAWDRWGKKPILPNQLAFDKLEKDLVAAEKKLDKPTSPPKASSTWDDWGDSPLAGRTVVRDLGPNSSHDIEFDKINKPSTIVSTFGFISIVTSILIAIFVIGFNVSNKYGNVSADNSSEWKINRAENLEETNIPGWIKTENRDCYVWNPAPDSKHIETVTWSGACTDSGSGVKNQASGLGIEQWYSDGNVGNRIEGTIILGRFSGDVLVNYPNGYKYIGTLDGDNGRQLSGILYDRDGKILKDSRLK